MSDACEPTASTGQHRDTTADPRVVDNPAASRYEIYVGGELAGSAQYRAHPEVIVFVHTEIDPGFGGQGLGGALARGALDDVRARGRRIAVLCPFIAAYLNKHPKYHDPSRRDR